MSDDRTIFRKAREAIEAGKLPLRTPDRMWGGPGTGSRCAVCGEPVRPDETELEFELPQDGSFARQTSRVHTRCFAAWAIVSQDAGALPKNGSWLADDTSDPLRFLDMR